MPFVLRNTPVTYQRCMMTIFDDLIEDILEIFIDDFPVFGDFFYLCRHNLELVFQRVKRLTWF